MHYGLGIDTGGTYTDAVLFDFETQSVVGSSKALTVREDLAQGILGAIDGLESGLLGAVQLVSLSTTLATNACVEGKGGRARLVLIGCSEVIVSRHGAEYGLPSADQIVFLAGGCSQQGEVIEEPDWEALASALRAQPAVDAYAVVELWGVRNPGFERKAKAVIEALTGAPTFCGHELTNELNSLKRAASALLNAQLIPLVRGFVQAVKASLAARGVNAPLVIVRGDGSLMSEQFAADHPVETLLSGPAASVRGGLALTGAKDCVLVDMGGTTSDIAVVRGGEPRIAVDGAQVGSWRTGIRSLQIDTIGLGGDSLLRIDTAGEWHIGPTRVAPLSWAAARWPEVMRSIDRMADDSESDELYPCEFFYRVREPLDPSVSEGELRVLQALQNGPLSLAELASRLGVYLLDLKTKRLEHEGFILRCGLTPTDLLHVTGNFVAWNAQAARQAASIFARRLGLSVEVLAERVDQSIKEQLYCKIATLVLSQDEAAVASASLTRLLQRSFRGAPGLLRSRFTLEATLVGLGAPTHLYLPDVARALGAEWVVPSHAGVANAVGAITGNVVGHGSVLILPQYSAVGSAVFRVFAPGGNREFEDYDDALGWATDEARRCAQAAVVARGASRFDTSVEVDTNALPGRAGQIHLIEARVNARAVGRLESTTPRA